MQQPTPRVLDQDVDPSAAPGLDPALAGPLEHLHEQLWSRVAPPDQLRIRRERPEPGWREVERYLVVPSVARARLLVPDRPGPVLRQAFLAYRRLRPRRAQAQRLALGAASRARVLPLPRVSVQLRAAGSAPTLPLARLEQVLGGDRLHAAIGIRTGANRKPTLQLFDDAGNPRGFAKIGWDSASATGLARECLALWAGPWTGPARVPRILAAGTLETGPYVVTQPLPAGVRAVRAGVAPPTPVELAALCPVVRRAPLRETEQFAALVKRYAALRPRSPETAALVARAQDLLDALGRWPVPVPVAARWHGDLTPWNVARDDDGTLWCWDWEFHEPDAAAGLDAVHWQMAVGLERGGRLGPATADRLAHGTDAALTALGVSAAGRAGVVGLWAAILAERALVLATAGSGVEQWDAGWICPDELAGLIAGAQQLVSSPTVVR